MSRKNKNIDPIITVNAVFEGSQTDSQAFIDLITQKYTLAKTKVFLDNSQYRVYNEDTSKMQNAQHTGGKV